MFFNVLMLAFHFKDIDESSAPLSVTEELKKSDHETVHILLTEWVNNIKSRGSFHHDMNYVAHFSQLSSGYESDHDESNFEDSFHKDFSAKILLLYNNCKSVSEVDIEIYIFLELSLLIYMYIYFFYRRK